MDEQTRKALGHLIEAVEALVESLWRVSDFSKTEAVETPYVAVLAEQRAIEVEGLLNRAKAIIEEDSMIQGGNR